MNRRAAGLVVVGVGVVLVCGGCTGGRRHEADLGGTGADERLSEEALQRDAGSLAQARAGVLGTERAPTGPLRDVRFAYDSFELDDEARRLLQENAKWLNTNPDVRVEVEGHCDERGTIEYNLALAAKRAAASKRYLVTLGVLADRITTISYGEELPVCHEPVEACWRRNRRDHFVVIGN